MSECKKKNSFGIGMQKCLQKQQVHIFISHIGHIKLASSTLDIGRLYSPVRGVLSQVHISCTNKEVVLGKILWLIIAPLDWY